MCSLAFDEVVNMLFEKSQCDEFTGQNVQYLLIEGCLHCEPAEYREYAVVNVWGHRTMQSEKATTY